MCFVVVVGGGGISFGDFAVKSAVTKVVAVFVAVVELAVAMHVVAASSAGSLVANHVNMHDYLKSICRVYCVGSVSFPPLLHATI